MWPVFRTCDSALLALGRPIRDRSAGRRGPCVPSSSVRFTRRRLPMPSRVKHNLAESTPLFARTCSGADRCSPIKCPLGILETMSALGVARLQICAFAQKEASSVKAGALSDRMNRKRAAGRWPRSCFRLRSSRKRQSATVDLLHSRDLLRNVCRSCAGAGPLLHPHGPAWERQPVAGGSNALLAPQKERLDLTAGKLSKQELDGPEIRPLVLVLSASAVRR